MSDPIENAAELDPATLALFTQPAAEPKGWTVPALVEGGAYSAGS